MKRRSISILNVAVILVAAGLVSTSFPSIAYAATLHVCPRGCRFHQLAPAIAAASFGDTIKVGPGTYKGGVTIDKSIKLVGAGTGNTTFKGGGPVLTIGRFLALNEPTVTISGITVTGGVTTKSPIYPAIAMGGGIFIPARHKFTPGAAVTIVDSVVTGNEVSPATTRPIGPPCPHAAHCPFGGAFGGGIGNEGKLTLIRTRVTNNKARGPRASDSDGAGIYSDFGSSLTLRHATVADNLARASGPIGRFAEGAGIFTAPKVTVVIRDSTIDANTASLSSSFPYFIGGGNTLELGVHSGGMQTSDNGTVKISDTRIARNVVTAVDLKGEPEVFDSGFCNCGSSKLSMRNTKITDNHVSATVKTLKDVFAAGGFSTGGALETDGPATIRRTAVIGNTTLLKSPHGAAIAQAMVFIGTNPGSPALISDSIVSGNTVRAFSGTGSEEIFGAGIVNTAGLKLRGDRITANRAVLMGKPGVAQGGGVWNGQYPGGPSPTLTIDGTTLTHNVLSGVSGSTLQGGGLFTTRPVMLSGNIIRHNLPNNCSGISC
jgi:hypothetical protein